MPSTGIMTFIYYWGLALGMFFIIGALSMAWEYYRAGHMNKMGVWLLIVSPMVVYEPLLIITRPPFTFDFKRKAYSNYDAYGWKLKQWIPKGSIVLGNDNLWGAFQEDYKFWGENAVIDGAGNRYFGKRVGEKVYTEWIDNYKNRILKDLKIQYIIIDDELYHYLTDAGDEAPWNKEFWELLKDNYEEIGQVQDRFYTSEVSRSRRPTMTVTKIYRLKGLK